MLTTSDEPLIGPEAVARLAGFSIRTIYKMHEDGRMPPSCSPTRKRLRWTRAAIHKWLTGPRPERKTGQSRA